MKEIDKHNLLNREIPFVLTFLIILSTMFTSPAYPGEFDLGEMDPVEVVDLPGTNMKGGMFLYEFNEEYKDGERISDRTWKAGILVDNKVLYYVHTDTEDISMLDPGGDCNFGIYKNYFTMDCWSYGASHNRIMYLFRFDKDKVELLDILNEAFVNASIMDFMSYTPEAYKPGFQRMGSRLPLWMEIKDFDGNGDPEIKLLILLDGSYDFDLYLELKGDKLHVNLNPALYKPLFEREKEKSKKKKTKKDAYYIYGFLSGELKLDEIRAEIGHKDEKGIIPLLEKKEQWDEAFHAHEVPQLIRYELKGRQLQ